MEQKDQKWDKILELFYEESSKDFTIRAISKKTKIPISTIQRYLKKLKKLNLIKDKKANITDYFKFKKTYFIIDKMFKIGLIRFLEEKYNPSCLIVFGSIRKGEYIKESDVDIFIETTKKTEVNLSEYEKKLKHNIQLFIEPDIKKLPDKLFNNVINGIKLKGYMKLR